MPYYTNVSNPSTFKKVLPTVSIITVVYNAVDHIEETLRSVTEQSWPAIEYIVVDGGSTDDTLDIIKKYKSKIAKLISEPDKGLYDAMNKGLREASGDYVWFMNAGDTIPTADTLAKAMELGRGADVIYGETYLKNAEGTVLGTRSTLTTRKLPEQLTYESLKKGMVVSHQSFIVQRNLAPFYTLDYKISADIDWMIRCLKKSHVCVNPGVALSCFLTNGISAQYKVKSWRERFQIFQEHFGLGPTILIHIKFFFRALFSGKIY